MPHPIWIPDRDTDIAFRAGFAVADIVGRHHFAVRTLDAAHVTDVPVYTVIAQNDLGPPTLALVRTQTRPDTKRVGSESIGQAQAPIL